ncbi:MAG: hypothetical protein NXY59_09055 [Aigarchaeota archaeon]|nr:hypothetical protein [Candidatus Pelearchaeum maunauluense]
MLVIAVELTEYAGLRRLELGCPDKPLFSFEAEMGDLVESEFMNGGLVLKFKKGMVMVDLRLDELCDLVED